MTEEIWKDIEGYEGLYQISSLGRVKSLERYEDSNSHIGIRRRMERILCPLPNRDDYLSVGLSKNGKHKTQKIHRLVAKAFLPNPDNLPEVNHKDEDKTNNCVDNLEWCDRGYNCNYGTRNKKIGKTSTNHPAKSKPVIALKDNRLCMLFASTSEAERNGFDHSHVSNCCYGKYKQHKGYRWMFLEDYLADWWDGEMDNYMEKEKAA